MTCSETGKLTFEQPTNGLSNFELLYINGNLLNSLKTVQTIFANILIKISWVSQLCQSQQWKI